MWVLEAAIQICGVVRFTYACIEYIEQILMFYDHIIINYDMLK